VDCIYLALFGDRWRASSCEHGSNVSGPIKDREFLEFTRNQGRTQGEGGGGGCSPPNPQNRNKKTRI
jgi:hypothetical protein